MVFTIQSSKKTLPYKFIFISFRHISELSFALKINFRMLKFSGSIPLCYECGKTKKQWFAGLDDHIYFSVQGKRKFWSFHVFFHLVQHPFTSKSIKKFHTSTSQLLTTSTSTFDFKAFFVKIFVLFSFYDFKHVLEIKTFFILNLQTFTFLCILHISYKKTK